MTASTTFRALVKPLLPHLRYGSYVVAHKWFVFGAGLKVGVPILRLVFHDWTKFLPCEWGPYVQFFYGHGMTRGQAAALNYDFPVDNATELAFEYAWNHHQNHQDHHWQHWIRFGDDGTILALPMPDVCRREMLADWRGAGRALGKPDTAEWYVQNQDKMKLHPDTRLWIQAQLGLGPKFKIGDRVVASADNAAWVAWVVEVDALDQRYRLRFDDGDDRLLWFFFGEVSEATDSAVASVRRAFAPPVTGTGK